FISSVLYSAIYFTTPLKVPKEVTDVKSSDRLLNCPILYCPTGPTYSVNKRCTKAEITKRKAMTPALREVIFKSKLPRMNSGIFNQYLFKTEITLSTFSSENTGLMGMLTT